MDLDDIWDQPLEAPSPPRRTASEHAAPSPSSPAKRRRTTLFLSSDSEGDGAAPTDQPKYRSRTSKEVPKDIDALFDDIDDDEEALGELAPPLDVDELRRQADARHAKRTPHPVVPSSSPSRDVDDGGGGTGRKGKDDDMLDGKKKRKPIARLDEARLLGRDGFPALVKQAKNFQPKGKGHEVSDLNRLLQVYQFWSHKMYPKTPFNDSVQRIEKLCHSKRMQSAVGVWRDEAKGLIHGRNPEELQSQDENDSDSDDSNNSGKEDDAPRQDRVQSREPEGEPQRAASSPPPRPPSSASEFTSGAPDDDFDIDAMLREAEEARVAATSQPGPSITSAVSQAKPQPAQDDDDDQAMWDEFDAFEDPVPASSKTSMSVQNTLSTGGVDEDEDMWDLVRELEQGQTQPSAPAPLPASTPATDQSQAAVSSTEEPSIAPNGSGPESAQEPRATNDEGWDEMYL